MFVVIEAHLLVGITARAPEELVARLYLTLSAYTRIGTSGLSDDPSTLG